MKKKLISLGLVLGVTLVTSVTTHANNSDTSLPYVKVGFQFSQAKATPVRAKDNYTSHYIKNTSGFNLWVQSQTSSGINKTHNGHAIIPVAERFIYNNIKEDKYHSCKLSITTATSGTSGYISGLWSPDSVGSYPVANP